MGNSTSGDSGRYRHGYHVLRVKDSSPASQAGLRPFFDYIMAVNDIRLDTESTVLHEQMEANEDKPIVLDVYSTREQAPRRMEMMPTKKWGDGNGGLMGCSIRFCMFDTISDVVWHVLDIALESPAELAGLVALSDYIIGTSLGIMRGESDLYDLVEDYIGEALPLHVYNVDTNQVREVIIVPSEEWGGEGLLGCNVGYGYLHRLPKIATTHPDAKGSLAELYEERDQDGSVATEEPHATDPFSPEAHGGILAPVVEHAENTNEPATERISDQKDAHDKNIISGTLETSVSPVQVLSSALQSKDPHLDQIKVSRQRDDSTSHDSMHTPRSLQESSNSLVNINESRERSGNVSGAPADSVNDHAHQPPPAIAARMIPGIHGRGHHGFPARDRISLRDAQDQAQRHSALYREQKERYDAEQAIAASTSQDTQDKEDPRGNHGLQDTDPTLEGMIRNMALGATVFPL
ncbi:hypothetical protein BGZ65_011850 [Modicella reniformis]|uniref:PDZ GRASP-type domain-containing protein n=1 Tax=Modicella reniformis TaxID=1440133 RepID=A0A9P6MBN9_9FUNG|nr:hypothetical protein BGZ65_011850 [Modicella reniformis]